MAEVSSQESSPTERKRIRQQKLGLRLDSQPYYTIAEQTATRLVLQSRPEANQPAGRFFMGTGIAVMLLAPVIIMGFFLLSGQSAGATFCGVGVAIPFAFVGLARWIGGRAVASTSNSITVDTEERTLVYRQMNKVGRQRSQTLSLEQVDHLRLQQRQFRGPGFPPRTQTVTALEFVTDEAFVWLVDSASDAAALEPKAAALQSILGVPLRDERQGQQA
jgi:hypothetical protein